MTIISIGCFADSQPTDAERKANLFIYNGMLFSIQHFESIGSQNNTVEFCGWTTKTSVANDAEKTAALNDALYQSVRKTGEITIPETVQAAVTYNGQLQGNATYKVIMLRADLFRAAGSGVTSQITKITIPKTVQHIESRCFDECVNMTAFVIEGATDGTSQLKEIDSHAFLNCKKLASITLPNSVTYLGDNVPNSIEGGANAFQESGLTCVHLKGDMTIGKETFMMCTGLKYVEIPATSNASQPLNNVSEGMFAGCTSLPFITLPASITTIKANAFNGCAALEYVNILADSPATLATNAFDNTPKDIYVKASKLSAYQANTA